MTALVVLKAHPSHTLKRGIATCLGGGLAIVLLSLET
jgi:hypothetical protein